MDEGYPSMSVTIPTLVIGQPKPRPTVNFQLDACEGGGVAVLAKHSEDRRWQCIAEIVVHEQTGVLELRTRDIYAPKLAEIMSVEPGKGIRTVFVNKSASLAEATS
jgi:hypothetical protein